MTAINEFLNRRNWMILLSLLAIALSGCSMINPPAPTPTPTAVPEESGDIVSRPADVVATGKVVPARVAQLSFDRSGRVLNVDVEEDDLVERGQALAQLEGQESLQAAVIAAELEVLSAQQDLDGLADNLEVAKASAFQGIVAANQVIGDTQYRLDNLLLPSAYEGMEIKDALELAKEKLDAARAAFEPYRLRSSGDPTRQDLREAVDRARSDFNAIMRHIELEAALLAAQADLAQAEQRFETLQAGPDPDAVALAEARLEMAQAQLDVAQKALEGLTLFAPMSGAAVMVDILPGETVLPGQAVITLADLSELLVETTDLSERDVAGIEVGQAVNVFVEALNLDVPGRVTRIDPQANTVGGDVVYTVVVELDEQPEGLRWGMTVEVGIESE